MRILAVVVAVLLGADCGCHIAAEEPKESAPTAVVIVHLGRPSELMILTVTKGKATGAIFDQIDTAMRAKGKKPPKGLQTWSMASDGDGSKSIPAVAVFKMPDADQEWKDSTKANDDFSRGIVAWGTLVCPTVPEGTTVLNGVLGPVQLVAEISDVTTGGDEKSDAVPDKGMAIVEGEVGTGKFSWGKEAPAELAFKNGTYPIILGGVAAKDAGGIKGPIRVTGTLEFDERARVRIVASKVQPLKR